MITRQLLIDWQACWYVGKYNRGDQRVDDIAGARTSMSPREVSALESVDLEHRMWVLAKALWYRSETTARTFAIDSAASVSHLAGRDVDQAEHARLVADLRRICVHPDAARDEAKPVWRAIAESRDAQAADWSSAVWYAWSAAWYAGGAAWTAVSVSVGNAAWCAGNAAALAIAYAARTADATAWPAARDAEMRNAIDRVLVALGPDAEGWSEPQNQPSASDGQPAVQS